MLRLLSLGKARLNTSKHQTVEPTIDLIELRPLGDAEKNFVINSWLRSLRAHSSHFAAVPAEIYYEAHAQSIKNCIAENNCLVATPRNEPEIIIGYLVWEDRGPKYVVLHYCYVKSNFRKMGLASILVDMVAQGRTCYVTHYTNKILLKDLRFNPYFFKQENF